MTGIIQHEIETIEPNEIKFDRDTPLDVSNGPAHMTKMAHIWLKALQKSPQEALD